MNEIGRSGQAVYKIDNSGKGMRPKGEEKRCIRKKGEANFKNVVMTSFRISIVLRGMGRVMG